MVVTVLAVGGGRAMDSGKSGEEGKKKSATSGKDYANAPCWRPGE